MTYANTHTHTQGGRTAPRKPIETGTQDKAGVDYQWVPDGAIPSKIPHNFVTLTRSHYYMCIHFHLEHVPLHTSLLISPQRRAHDHHLDQEKEPRNNNRKEIVI